MSIAPVFQCMAIIFRVTEQPDLTLNTHRNHSHVRQSLNPFYAAGPASSRDSSLIAISRILNFWILPLAVMG